MSSSSYRDNKLITSILTSVRHHKANYSMTTSLNHGTSNLGSGEETSARDGSLAMSVPRESLELNQYESCAYLAPTTALGCRRPRSCRSCLQKTRCMISGDGTCTSQPTSGFNRTVEYRNAFKSSLVLPTATATNPQGLQAAQRWHFPALEATYCPVDDAVCSKCIASNFERESSSQPDSRFCVGTGGCVCIDDCERAWAQHEMCNAPSPASIANHGRNDSAEPQRLMVAVPCIIVAFACLATFFVVRRLRKKRRVAGAVVRENRRRHDAIALARQQPRSQGASALALSGWQDHRFGVGRKQQVGPAGVDSSGAWDGVYAEIVDAQTLPDPRYQVADAGISRAIHPEPTQKLTNI